MSTKLKQDLLATLRKLVRRQSLIRNWQVAVEQGSIIRRIYPDQATAREVDEILSSRSQVTEGGSSLSGHRIWNVSGGIKKKGNQKDVVTNPDSKMSMGRIKKQTSGTETKPKVEEEVILDSRKLALMSPSQMEEYAGGLDKLRIYAKSIGLKIGNHGLAKVSLLIKQEIAKLDVSSRTEEE